MADITLSPIPYNNGTLSLAGYNSHICSLSDTRFFALFGQSTPNYTFGAVIDVANIRSSSPSVTVTKQRVIATTALTRGRVWKLASNRVLILNNSTLQVYEIDGTGDIVAKSGNLASFHSTYLWGVEGSGTSGIGDYLVGQYIKDNTVWFIQRTSTTSAISFFKITYDPVSDTLTKTAITTLAASTTSTHVWRYYIQKFSDSSNYLVYGVGSATTVAAGYVVSAFVYDQNGTQVLSISNIPTTTRLMVPLSDTRILGLSSSRTWRMFDGAVWTDHDASFAGAYVSGTVLVDAEALDDTYFMLVSTTSGAEPGTGTYSFRVSRVLDPYLGQSSTPTNTNNGISYATLNAYFDQKRLLKFDANTFFLFGRASTTSFRIRTIYQA